MKSTPSYTLQELSELFQNQGKRWLASGSLARAISEESTTENLGVLEWYTDASSTEINSWKTLELLSYSSSHTIWVCVRDGGMHLYGLIHCLSDSETFEKTLKAALAQRGFAADAWCIDEEGQRLDPWNGWIAFQKRSLCRLQQEDAGSFFSTTPAHLLRWARLQSEYAFVDDDVLQAAANKEAGRILYARRLDWFSEMTGLLCSPNVCRGMQRLFDTRVLGMILPEIHNLVGFAETSLYHHKDLWTHTLQVVSQAKPYPILRWAALLHDVGKIWTRTYGPKQAVHFYQHEEHGAVLVEGIATRFHWSPECTKHIAFLVRHHQRPNAYKSEWSDTAVRRLMREAGPYLSSLLHLSQADCTSSQIHRVQRIQQLATELQQRIQNIQKTEHRTIQLPRGLGSEIMHFFQLEPGPQIGRIKTYLKNSIEDGILLPNQASEYYMVHLRNTDGWHP